MSDDTPLSRQGHRLLQVGIGLFLFTSFEGSVLERFAVPRLGLSVHTLGALQGVMLLALGLLWPRLNLNAIASRFAFWLLLYSNFAILVAYLIAGIWGAGNSYITAGRRISSRQYSSGNDNHGDRVFISTNRYHFLCAPSLGPPD